jgi:hypothetical protein
MSHVIFGRQYPEEADGLAGWRRAQLCGPQTKLKSDGAARGQVSGVGRPASGEAARASQQRTCRASATDNTQLATDY